MIFALAGGAFALALLLGWALALSGPVDRPNGRSSHVAPTPTAGGLAVVAATVAALLAAEALGWGGLSPELRLAVLAVALAAGALGLYAALDDLFDLGVLPKLGAQAAVALLLAAFVTRAESLPLAPGLDLPLGPVLGLLGTALWLVVLTNVVNFVDGANGLAPGVQAIAAAAFAFVAPDPATALLASALSAASIALLIWNLPLGRLFQGDVGALFSALTLGALAVMIPLGGVVSLWFGPTVLLPVLVDALLTLAVRARRGERVFSAHREHLYQLWLQRTGKPHAALAWRVWALTAACVGAALAGEALGQPFAVLVLTAAAMAFAWTKVRSLLGATRYDTAR